MIKRAAKIVDDKSILVVVRNEEKAEVFRGSKFDCIHFMNQERRKGKKVDKWKVGLTLN